MSTRPQLDLRWTRTCFCGQEVPGGRVASEPMAGIPFLTGSEEGRGPLYDETGVPFEGRRTEGSGFESQGHKVGVPGATSTETVPQAVPLMTVRVADRVIASLPAEPTVEVGRRVRQAVLGATRDAGVRRVIVSGLANEFIQYLTTPEEYDRQHYEGGSTLYGPLSAVLLTQELGTLAGRMARGEPAQPPIRSTRATASRPMPRRSRRAPSGDDRDAAGRRGRDGRRSSGAAASAGTTSRSTRRSSRSSGASAARGAGTPTTCGSTSSGS